MFNHAVSNTSTMIIQLLTVSVSVLMTEVTFFCTVFKKKDVTFVGNIAHLTRKMKGFPNPVDLSDKSISCRACRQSREFGTSLNKP